MSSNSAALRPLAIETEDVDHLVLLDGDSRGRKIFLAYTMRIPWARRDGKPITRKDESCYPAGAKKT